MPDLPPAAPYDALFRALLADSGRADTLVREYLPPAVAAELSDAPIRWRRWWRRFRGQPEEGVLRRILSGVPDGSELELQVLSYIVRTYELTPAVLETAARAAKPERWEALMSTVAEAWVREAKAEGRVEGRAEGRAEGKAETLIRLLQRRFGPVTESVRARVAVGSAAEIDAWFDALLDAQSLTEVFDTGRH